MARSRCPRGREPHSSSSGSSSGNRGAGRAARRSANDHARQHFSLRTKSVTQTPHFFQRWPPLDDVRRASRETAFDPSRALALTLFLSLSLRLRSGEMGFLSCFCR